MQIAQCNEQNLRADLQLEASPVSTHDTLSPTFGERTFTFIDLFAGIGGMRLGLEQAAQALGLRTRCVFTSEIKPAALKVLRANHPDEPIHGDITQIESKDIPNFDILLAGFPCQAFSYAGKRRGFDDTRGTLFFEIQRILADKKPQAFLLENVEGLVSHDKNDASAPIGRTLSTILDSLKSLGYQTSWFVLSATDYGIPQERKRIYIVGHTGRTSPLPPIPTREKPSLESILEKGLPSSQGAFVTALLKHYCVNELIGKSIKDKRGGSNNIHSWQIGIKGEVSRDEARLLEQILCERRKKKWATEYGIDWMDGMTLSFEQIKSFYPAPNLEEMLTRLTNLGYLKREYPKRRILDKKGYIRVQDPSLPLGYNIVSGKLSYPISKILDPKGVAPTLVATDISKLYVVDGEGIRPLSLREGLRLSGYPDGYSFPVSETEGYDLIGNTVVVPVVRVVAQKLLGVILQDE